MLNMAWRIVDDTHPITRAALQVIINDYESKLSSVRELHKAVNGPYDDSACEHCTYIMRIGRPDAPEDAYVGFPCKTIKALDGETDV